MRRGLGWVFIATVALSAVAIWTGDGTPRLIAAVEPSAREHAEKTNVLAKARFEERNTGTALVSIEEGDLLKQGGAATNFTQSIEAASGRANAAVLRSQPSGASGRGKFASLVFKARGPGVAQVRATSFEPIGPAGVLPPLTALPILSIQIK